VAKKNAIQFTPDDRGIVPGSPDDYIFESYANIPEEDPDWFWPDVIPTAGLTLVEGDPSAGKSTFVMDIVARAIRGESFPDGSVCPFKNVEAIYQCTEVGKPGIVSKILGNSGTPKEAVHLIRGDNLTLSDVRIQRGLREGNVRVLIIDPMQQYFEGDMNNAISARRELSALSDFAVQNNAAVILIRHFGKEKQRVAQHDGLGSVDISAIARSILQVDCEDLHSPIRFLRQAKNSYAPLVPDLAFEFCGLGKINWIGPVTEGDKKPLLDEAQREAAPKLAAVILDMFNLLSERDYPSSEICAALLELGHSRATILRAKDKMQIESIKKGRKWYWHLPEGAFIALGEE